jgi:hypothetical protein
MDLVLNVVEVKKKKVADVEGSNGAVDRHGWWLV